MGSPSRFRVLVFCAVSAVAVACGNSGSGGNSEARPGTATASSGFAEPTSSSPSEGSPSGAAPSGSPSSNGSGPGGHPSGGSPLGSSTAGSSSTDGLGTADASPADPPENAPPTSPPPASPPPAEDTDEPLPSTSTGSQPRTVRVSGPTIDNRYPADMLRFPAGETRICNPFTTGSSPNGGSGPAGVPVTIRTVELVNQLPSGAPVFEVIPVQDLSTCLLDAPPQSAPLQSVGNCVGATLPPYSEEGTTACILGLEFSGATEYTATVRFHAEAICADTEASPCDAEEVRALTPTPTAPITVRWFTDVGTVTGCPENPSTEGSGDCPGG